MMQASNYCKMWKIKVKTGRLFRMKWDGVPISLLQGKAVLLSLERYGDQQLRRRACPEFVADQAMFLMLLEVILFL